MPSFVSVVFPYKNDASRGIKYILPLDAGGFSVVQKENEGRWVWDDEHEELYDLHQCSYYSGVILSGNAYECVRLS